MASLCKKEKWVQPPVPDIRQGYLPYLLLHAVKACLGLALFGVGVYCTIRANIGTAPWDAMVLGLSDKLQMQFGNVQIMVSCTLIIIDLLLRAPIGFGTLLDAIVVGKTVDLMNRLAWLPMMEGFFSGILLMSFGVVLESFGMYLYMKQALSCGPRDSLMVALGLRVRRFPIGVVNAMLMLVILLIGWLLGGPVGIGTVVAVAEQSLFLQIVCHLMNFEPRDVVHDHLLMSLRRLKRSR